MSKIKVSELSDEKLDYWVAKADGKEPVMYGDKCYVSIGDGAGALYSPSTDWSEGGPIMERERISLMYVGNKKYDAHLNPARHYRGTMLIAAMRCYVASKFGEEVEE